MMIEIFWERKGLGKGMGGGKEAVFAYVVVDL
jgi:hypothetical protein